MSLLCVASCPSIDILHCTVCDVSQPFPPPLSRRSRVVDEAVDLAKLLQGNSNEVLQILLFANVALDKDDTACAQSANLVRQLDAVLGRKKVVGIGCE